MEGVIGVDAQGRRWTGGTWLDLLSGELDVVGVNVIDELESWRRK